MEAPLHKWKAIFLALRDMGVLFVNLSGGEVTTYSEFDALIAYLQEIELPFYLTSNGVIPKDRLQRIMANKVLMGMKISLDGISPESYLHVRDPVRKNEVIYKTVMNTLKQLKESNIFVEIATLVHSKNVSELMRYPGVLASLGIKKWDLGLLMPEGRGLANKDALTTGLDEFKFDKAFVQKISEEAERHGIFVSFGDLKFETLDKPIFECGAGIDFMSIQYDLSVHPCPLLPYSRFKDKYEFKLNDARDIESAWRSKPFLDWIDQKINGCPTCALRQKCGRCIIQLGEEGKSDPYENISACFHASLS